MTSTFVTVGVVGLGTMGAGIAECFARAGISVIGVEAGPEALARGRGHLEDSTGRALAKGRLTEAARAEILGRVTLTTSLEDLADADLVIEAVPEVMDFKRAIFTDLDRICKPSAVLATNTSSLSITAIAATTTRPGRVIGMHFFNPAPVMKLIEVIHTMVTDEGLAEEVAELARRLGKTPVTVGDRAGFVVNRLLLPYLNHAAVLLESGLAGRDDIDTAMRLGAGLPMGPFALLDLIGLDTSYEVLSVLFQESRDRRHAPAPILRERISAGLLGRKAGGGFYGPGEHADTSHTSHTSGAPGPSADEPSPKRVAVLGEGGDAFAARLADEGLTITPVEEAEAVLALSSVPVIELAPRLPHPERLVGVHLVGEGVAEVASTVLTDPRVARAVQSLVRAAGRVPVPCRDRAEFVVDALLYPYLNDAVRMYDSGYATCEDIDVAMRLGCGYRQGPFETIDALGLETVRDGLRALYAEYREPFLAPAPLLEQLVAAGVRSFRDRP
ncbi:3-hydroxyacyl-CoA dehydrogenase family protein [Streptosporangium sp. NPDC050855]|uniref:3-hydroxyacyl-CoA dehydrogenase family protein n=1 Tax=Streptosporangium sp. NPDC050855 TaxID=3366194 RepID=UPI0037B16A61